jgi:parvulin-like peptidyl-prolyl isomerase
MIVSRRIMMASALLALVSLASAACGGDAVPPGDASGEQAAGGDAAQAEEASLTPIAVVNGVPIPRVLYSQTLDYLRERIPQGEVERYLNAKFDAMESIINDELLYQEALRQGLSATDQAVQSAFEDAATRAGGEEAFLTAMTARGFTKTLVHDTIRKRQTIDRFLQERVLAGLEVTEEEELDYYNENLERFTPETWVRVQRILIRVPLGADASDISVARRRAESVLSLLRRGEKFETMAHEYSEDQVAPMGGDLGFIKRGVASPRFDAVAFNLRPGEISEVVEDESGFHIIRLIERRGGQPTPFAEVRTTCRERALAKKKDLTIRGVANHLRGAATIETFEE